VPDKGIDAVASFIRDRLLPQDRAAALAYNRATDFTTDRAALLTTIDRFKKAHDKIEADLDQWFSSLRTQYGGSGIPDHIQAQVDAVFRARGGAQARQLPDGAPADAAAITRDTRQNLDAAMRAEIVATRDPSPFDAFDIAAGDLVGMSFDQYAKSSNQSTQDLANIYTGIRYLRYLDGEKHLVFVTESGMLLPRLENDYSVAALASDARVVIDVLMTGGLLLAVPAAPTIPGRLPSRGGVENMPTVSFGTMFAVQTERTIAGLTGGMFNGYTPSAKTLAAIDASSRFQYLLGYVPDNGTFDGRFRRIAVKVNRPGVKVLSRLGYYARRDDTPYDRRQFMTYSRVTAAANTDAPMTDLIVSATAAYEAGAADAALTIALQSDRIAFEHTPGHHRASLQIVMMAGDDRQRLFGEHWQTVDLDLTDANYQTFLDKGVSITQAIPVQGTLKYVKVVVYDYASDRLGTATVTIERR
jgi:hypothetical protein